MHAAWFTPLPLSLLPTFKNMQLNHHIGQIGVLHVFCWYIFFFGSGLISFILYERLYFLFVLIIYFFYFFVLVWLWYVLVCNRWDRGEARENEEWKRKGMREKKLLFYSTRDYFKSENMFGVATVIATLLSSSRELL